MVFLPTSGHVEGPGVEQQLASHVPGVDLGQVGEADVVADAQSDLSEGRLERGEVGTGRQRVRLPEGDLAGDVDVEEVDLAVHGDHVACRGPDRGRVVELVRGVALRNGSPHQIDLEREKSFYFLPSSTSGTHEQGKEWTLVHTYD